VIVAIVLATLVAVVTATVFGGEVAVTNLESGAPGGVWGVLQAGGLLFFAFAGYARIATLGEEVQDPARTIPRAIPIALGIVVVVYATVLVAVLLAVGPTTWPRRPHRWLRPSKRADGRRWHRSSGWERWSRRRVCCSRCWPG
jgi:amino acid transporter